MQLFHVNYNTGTTFWGHSPLKIWEDKKRAKFSVFTTTFDFDHKYLWNG